MIERGPHTVFDPDVLDRLRQHDDRFPGDALIPLGLSFGPAVELLAGQA
jgi:hypothetical protein